MLIPCYCYLYAYDYVFYLVKKALSKLKVLQSLLVHGIHFSEFSLNCGFL